MLKLVFERVQDQGEGRPEFMGHVLKEHGFLPVELLQLIGLFLQLRGCIIDALLEVVRGDIVAGLGFGICLLYTSDAADE